MSWRAPARRFPVLAIRDFRLLLADRLLGPFEVPGQGPGRLEERLL